YSPSRINFDRGRWYRLHRRHDFLCLPAYSFRSFCMASSRPGRNALPFLCGPLVCWVSFLDSGAPDRHSLLMLALMTFGVGFLMRPIGAVILGIRCFLQQQWNSGVGECLSGSDA